MGKAVAPLVRSSLHVGSAFVMCGLIHEYLTWAAFRHVTECYMSFFGLHCMGVLLEALVQQCTKRPAMHHVPAKAGELISSKPHGRADGAAEPAGPQGPAAACIRVEGSSASDLQTGPGHAYGVSSSGLLLHCWAWVYCVLTSPLFLEYYRAGGVYGQRAFQPFGFQSHLE